jgi:alanyl-tRNA synthetase
MSAEEIHSVEHEVNRLIRNAISLAEYREVPIAEAKSMGAKALFGEKYGEKVRIIKFDESIELCGGTHVGNTSEIGMFKIVSESAIAAGIRRIEAITSKEAELFFNRETEILNSLRNLLKNPKNILQSVENLLEENSVLKKEFEKYEKDRIKSLKDTLYSNAKKRNGLNIVIEYIDTQYAGKLKDIAVLMRNEIENLFLVLVAQTAEGKVNLTVAVSDNLVKEKGFDAGKIIREIAKEIDGSGGGQPTIATAGGKNPQGIDAALKKAESFV